MPDVKPQVSKQEMAPPPAMAEPRVEQRTPTAEENKSRMVELLKKVQILRGQQLRGGELTGKDPAKVYMWVNSREDRQAFFAAWGWVLCVDPKVQSAFRKEDLTHRRADVILYELDRDMYDAIEYDKQLRGLEGIEGHKNAAIAQFHRQGVKEYIPNV